MKKMIGTIVEGTIGILALYVVGHITFTAGKELGKAEEEYRVLTERIHEIEGANEKVEASVPAKKQTLVGPGVKSLIFRNIPVVGKLLDKPEEHKVEAFVENGGIHIDVKEKGAK